MSTGLFLCGNGQLLPTRVKQSLIELYKVLDAFEVDQSDYTNLSQRINQIEDITKTELIKSGKQTFFVFHITFVGSIDLILKLYDLPFRDIIHYILSQQEVMNRLPEWVDFGENELKFKPVEVFGVGLIHSGETNFPFILQEYSSADSLSKLIPSYPHIKVLLEFLGKYLGHAGFIIDIAPDNIRVNYIKERSMLIIYYLDLILFSDSELSNYSKSIALKLANGVNVNGFMRLELNPTKDEV